MFWNIFYSFYLFIFIYFRNIIFPNILTAEKIIIKLYFILMIHFCSFNWLLQWKIQNIIVEIRFIFAQNDQSLNTFSNKLKTKYRTVKKQKMYQQRRKRFLLLSAIMMDMCRKWNYKIPGNCLLLHPISKIYYSKYVMHNKLHEINVK